MVCENGTLEYDLKEFHMSEEEFENLLKEMDDWASTTFVPAPTVH